MKTPSYFSRAIGVVGLGALAVFAGCTNAPLRSSTLALESQNAAGAVEMDRPGYEAPKALQTVKPEYPLESRRHGVSGEVQVIVAIDETGRVIDTQVARTSDPMFDQAALKAVKQWTFRPATQDGVAIASRVNIPVRFQFKDE